MTVVDIDYDHLVSEYHVHSRAFTDERVFDDEMERIFHRGWVYVGHEAEVPEVGDYKTLLVGRQPVIMCRDPQGEVCLLINRCRHRGAQVCQAESGNANTFRCAYHGWTYRISGELIGAPFSKAYGEEYRKEELGLARVPRVGNYRGFVFASLSSKGMSFEDYLPRSVQDCMDRYINMSPTGRLDMRRGVYRTYYEGNWKHALENGSGDAYHPYFAHESWMNLIKRRLGGSLKAMAWKDGGPDKGGEVQRKLGGPAHFVLDYAEVRRKRALEEGLKIPNATEQSIIAATPVPGPQSDRTRAREVFPEMTEHEVETYLADMNAAYGPDRAFEILTAGGVHMSIWPNLQITPLSIRIIHPVAVDRTEISVFIPWYEDVPDAFNIQRQRGAEMFFGPSAHGGQDDYEMYERIQRGLAGETNPWNFLARGLHRERVGGTGLPEGGITDEMSIRALWQWWKKVMKGEESVRESR